MSGSSPRNVTALVTSSRGEVRGATDSEVRVSSLEELYAACRDGPPSKLVRIVLQGEDGEVRLHFASFQRRRRV